jgi:hypothetical protein
VGTSAVKPELWAARLRNDLDALDQRAIAVARELTAEQLNWRPSPASWSIGQCLQHLLQGNEVYLPPLTKALEGKPQAEVAEITPGWFARWFIRSYLEPSPTTKKAPAPKKIAPAETIDTTVLDRFLHSNQAVRDLIGSASHYDVNGIRFENPFIPLLRFTVGTGLLLTTAHQRRHLLQAERVRQAPNFPN